MKFECKKALNRSAVNRLINMFETIGSVIDNKKGVVSKEESVRTPGNIHRVEETLTQSPRKSVKHLSQQLNVGCDNWNVFLERSCSSV
jgi:hypothetical protein